ncbi:amino acid transporter, putative [Perkinsus marinus ATCC 50983]|uniref:Amino acid transporter, putative n=1 Tax=Perkinsus marinus (strain ATCC 50983 / TXsc) TaxID=423536 RepID=C5LSK0_PERM5|nr:amino acid transporter, putative [Perkinsus marinus ATCC 50983]EER00241.1 amino acid transporter, putative [Perkinsus marinus ATCC 50983]|eukprot:XP_002767523.1 amino acid transporter, putative [Perkinsus marinus ATCC 50983]
MSTTVRRTVEDADLIMFRNYAGYVETRMEDSWRPDDEAEESLQDSVEEPLIGKQAAEQVGSFVTSRHRTSSTSVGVAILKANLGSGILYLPRAWVNGGWLFSTLVLPILAFMAATCSLRLVACRRVVRQGSYGEIMQKATGSTSGKCFIDLSLLALQSGICTGYFVFVANMASDISPWIASLSFSTKVNFPTYRFPIESSQQVFIQAVVIAPLCWFRQVSNLSFTNLLANVGCPILVIIIHSVYYTQFCSDPYCMQPLWPHRLHRNRRPWSVPISNEASDLSPYVFEGIGLILPTYDSMREPHKFDKVFTQAFTITTASFLFIGIAGYIGFGPDTQTIVLSNLPEGSLLTIAVKAMYTIAVFITMPFQLLPAVRLVEYYSGLFPKQRHVSFRRKMAKNIFRLSYLFFLAGIALIAGRDLDHFISLIGSMCGLPLVFIAPPICHMKLIGDTTKSDACILIFGLLVMVSATVSNIINFGTH